MQLFTIKANDEIEWWHSRIKNNDLKIIIYNIEKKWDVYCTDSKRYFIVATLAISLQIFLANAFSSTARIMEIVLANSPFVARECRIIIDKFDMKGEKLLL